MKTITLTQAQKPHNVNKLHDAFIAAEIPPLHVESNQQVSRFSFSDEIANPAIQAVITNYQISPPPVPIDVKQAWNSYTNAVQNASTLPQIKTAITNDLGQVLKALSKALADS